MNQICILSISMEIAELLWPQSVSGAFNADNGRFLINAEQTMNICSEMAARSTGGKTAQVNLPEFYAPVIMNDSSPKRKPIVI